MIRIAYVLLLLAAASLAQPARAQKDVTGVTVEISGVFEVVRKGNRGKVEEGILHVVKRGDTYRLVWSFDSGSNFSGLGLRTGDKLAVAWEGEDAEEKGKKAFGVTQFQITVVDGRPRLVGRWATRDGPLVEFSETANSIKQKPEK